MNKNVLFIGAVMLLNFGGTLIGYGAGKLFDKSCEGTSIGLGLGMSVTSFILFSFARRLVAFSKK